jgi:DNA-directed RNA polymerase specialized sigma24 family protein
LADTEASGGSPDLLHQLQEVRQDPQVIRLALRWAGNRELAEDALQTTYYRVASVQHPESIVNLRAYFLRALKNEITGLYALPRPVLVDNVETLNPPQPGTALDGPAAEPAVDDQACTTVQTQIWLKRHASQRDRLVAVVPARSTDPARYREVVYAAAKQVLLGHLSLEPNDAAFPNVLRAVYPGHFDEPGAVSNTLHQRLSRVREDIKALLRAFIKRDELF